MKHKKLLIAIIAIVLVAAVLLVMYFDYRSKHSMSLMGDEELIQYLTESKAERTLEILDISSIRAIIRELEKDQTYSPSELIEAEPDVLFAFCDELRPAFRDYYGINPQVVQRRLMSCEKLMIALTAILAVAVLLLLYLVLFKRSSINRKKLWIVIVAIVLVAAVLLTIYFDYRSKHSLSLMSDEELLQYFEDNDIRLGWKLHPSQLRALIQGFEHDPDCPNNYGATNFYFVYEELREVVKEYYGITPVNSAETPPSDETSETTETTETLTAPKIAATSSEGMKPAHLWYWDETTQLRYGNVPLDEMLFLVDAETALAGLANGTYDVAILPCASSEAPSFGAYGIHYLSDDAIIFVHGNPTSPDASYDLTLETIRSIYEDGGEFYWDAAKQEPLVPAFRFDYMSQELSYLFDIESTADEIIFGEEYSKYIWEATRGSALHPLYYSFLSGDAGIDGVVISVDGVLPTETTVTDRTYPLSVTFYAVYPTGNPNAARLAAELQTVAQQQP